MAKIPDATGLIQGGAPRSNRGGIVSFNSGAGEGLMQAGKVMGQVGAEIEQKIDADDKVAAARAMLRFQQEEAALEEEIRQDPSQYETIRSRYAERYGKAFNESVGALQNPRNKELFTLAAKEVYTKTDSRLAGVRDKYYSEHLDADYLSNLEAAKNRVRPDMSPEDLQAQLMPFNVLADNAGKVQGVDAAMRKKLQAKAELEKAWLDKKSPQEVFDITNAQIKNQPLNVRNNNPGNLRGADGQFRKFATAEEGLAAMKADLTAKVSGSSGAMKRNFGEGYKPSLRNIINTYAPKSENDTDAYIASVAKDTGLDPDAPLSAADVEKIMPAMIKVEGGSQSMAYYQGYKLDSDVAMAKYNESKAYVIQETRKLADDDFAAAESGLLSKPSLELGDFLGNEKDYQSYKNTFDTKAQIGAYSNMSFDDIAKDINLSKVTTPKNASENQKLLSMKQAAAKEDFERWKKDPAMAVYQTNPVVKSLFDSPDFGVDPVKTKAAIDESVRAQKAKGVLSPKLLIESRAEQISDQIKQAESRGADNVLLYLSAQKEVLGDKYYSQVIGEISPKLSPAVAAASVLDISDKGAKSVASDIIQSASRSLDDIGAGLSTGDKTSIKDGVAAKLADLQKTLYMTNPGAGASTYSQVYDGALKAAYLQAARGSSATDAVNYATSAFIKNYEIQDTYRVPNVVFSATDGAVSEIVSPAEAAPMIASATSNYLNTLKQDDLYIPKNISNNFASDVYVDAVKSRGRWINSGDEQSLRLVDEFNMPVFDKNGIGISLPLTELINRARKLKSESEMLDSEFSQGRF